VGNPGRRPPRGTRPCLSRASITCTVKPSPAIRGAAPLPQKGSVAGLVNGNKNLEDMSQGRTTKVRFWGGEKKAVRKGGVSFSGNRRRLWSRSFQSNCCRFHVEGCPSQRKRRGKECTAKILIRQKGWSCNKRQYGGCGLSKKKKSLSWVAIFPSEKKSHSVWRRNREKTLTQEEWREIKKP